MEISSLSYIDNIEYNNNIELILNKINCIIDYGCISSLIVKQKKFILIDNIKKILKSKNLKDELKKYNNYNELIDMFNITDEFLEKKYSLMTSSEIRICYNLLNMLLDEEIIILNNPTDSLDYNNIKKLCYVLKNLKNKTILVISDDLEFINKIADNLIVIKDKIICSGNKYDVFLNKKIKDVPYTIKFSKKVYEDKKIKIGYRDDINDLIKDIYRYVK